MAIEDTTGEIDLNPALALEKVDSWLDGLIKLAPNIAVAIVIFLLFFIGGVIAKRLTQTAAARRGRENLGDVLGGFFKSVILVMGFLIALTIVVPSLKPGDLIAGLGIGSVAIGFAFKDILQNWLAGLLILLRQPFDVGDQIEANGYVGTVERIETRATLIRTFAGERAVIPNSDIYTNAVLVKTAYDKRRSQYDIGIGYGDDIDEACRIVQEELSKIDGIEKDPAPEAFAWDLAASWVTIRARWWTDSVRGNVVKNKANAIRAIKRAFDDAGIDMPFDTEVQLFHDQTEDRDGLPGTQREGWPAPKDQEVKPRWQKKQEMIEQNWRDDKERASN